MDAEFVTMSDGTRLQTAVYLPADDAGTWPALLYRTPYSELRSSVWQQWANLGYAVVVQATRGRNGSGGSDLFFAADGWGQHTDGLDTVEWMLDQSWSNGRIGGIGASAPGITQNLLAGADPPNMYGQWLEDTSANLYDGTVFQGGVFRQSQILAFLEDNNFGEDSYSLIDGHPTYDEVWEQYDMTRRQQLREYPVGIFAGWYDTFLEASIDNFTSIKASGGTDARQHSKLIIGLSGHDVNEGAIPWPAAAAGPPPGYESDLFLQEYVQGEPNGYGDLPDVAYYVMGDLLNPFARGNEWRFAESWPVPAVDTPLFLYPDGVLRLVSPITVGTSRSYDYDPENPVPTLGGANLTLPIGNFDQRPIENRSDVLLFEVGPLLEPVTVIGMVKAFLFASSTQPDTDFTAKLTDVYPDGRSILLADGILRARYRDSFAEPELMNPGTVYEFLVEIGSTAIVFHTGHRIRLAISSSNAPRFAPNPNTGAEPSLYDPLEPVTATNRIFMDATRPSALILPIVED
jgi:predicted acyl esterase